MDMVISLLVLSTLPQVVVHAVPLEISVRAVVEQVSGQSRIFSGEHVQLKCSVPDNHRSTWRYLWFRGSEQLEQSGEHFFLWNTRVKDGGKFSCQGVRDTVVGNIHTLQSLPVEISVDGGWAILEVPPLPGLVGNTLEVTCRVRDNPRLSEVFLYKDGVQVQRFSDHNPNFYLTNLTLKDQGIYSCRASWDSNRRTHSVISVDTPVNVLEVLSQPVLEIVSDLVSVDKMKLICHVQYNAPAPAPPIHYYFYKNNIRMGIATSENYDLVRWAPGSYSCKAKVPELNLSRLSEPKHFGQKTERETTMMPQTHLPRDLLPLTTPDLPLPAARLTEAQHSSYRSTAAPSFTQPTEVQPSDRVRPSQPAQSTPLSTVTAVNQTAVDFSQESGDVSDDMSGNYANPEGSGDMSGYSVTSHIMSSTLQIIAYLSEI